MGNLEIQVGRNNDILQSWGLWVGPSNGSREGGQCSKELQILQAPLLMQLTTFDSL